MVVELYKKAKSLTYELAWEIAWREKKKKKKEETGRLKRSCETAKGKCDTVREEEEKKKREKKVLKLTRDLISFNLYFCTCLVYNVFHDISHCLFFSPLFTLSSLFFTFFSFFFFFTFLSSGLLCRRHESFFLSRLPFHSGSSRFNLSRSLSIFLLFFHLISLFFFFWVATFHSLIHISHSHICRSLITNIISILTIYF